MKTLTIEQMEQVNGDGVVETACAILAGGSAVYGWGLFLGWWNPIGWLSATLLVADTACAGYALATL